MNFDVFQSSVWISMQNSYESRRENANSGWHIHGILKENVVNRLNSLNVVLIKLNNSTKLPGISVYLVELNRSSDSFATWKKKHFFLIQGSFYTCRCHLVEDVPNRKLFWIKTQIELGSASTEEKCKQNIDIIFDNESVSLIFLPRSLWIQQFLKLNKMSPEHFTRSQLTWIIIFFNCSRQLWSINRVIRVNST